MCMLMGRMVTRTVGQLEEVGVRARRFGKVSVILPWKKARQGLVLVLVKTAMFIQNSADYLRRNGEEVM